MWQIQFKCLHKFHEFLVCDLRLLRKVVRINCLATKGEVLIFIEIWLSSTMGALSSGCSLISSARPTVRTFLDPSRYWQSWPVRALVTSYFCSGLLCSPVVQQTLGLTWCPLVLWSTQPGNKAAGCTLQVRLTAIDKLAPCAMACTVDITTSVLGSGFFRSG